MKHLIILLLLPVISCSSQSSQNQPEEKVPDQTEEKTISESPMPEEADTSILPDEPKPADAKPAGNRPAPMNSPEPVMAEEAVNADEAGGSADIPEPYVAVVPNPGIGNAPVSHELWDKLLNRNVSSAGRVDYQGFKADRQELNEYLRLLAKGAPQKSWPRNEQMAYWINAYNAFTIDLIVSKYPVGSITDLDGGKTWDVKRIVLGDKKYSLNQIENEILRPQFGDPRIHFAVNCAARSCPPLWNHAFTASNLNSALNRRTKQFINDRKYNQISANEVRVSKIFEWYSADFGNLISFLNKYNSQTIEPDANVVFNEYDWKLNK